MTKKKIPLTSVTAQEIRGHNACWSEFAPFLRDMKVGSFNGYVQAGTPRFAYTDPIPLVEILKTKSTAMHGIRLVRWLLNNIPRLKPLMAKRQAADKQLMKKADQLERQAEKLRAETEKDLDTAELLKLLKVK